MNTATDKIIERVKALLAMAADTASPHEAAIAAGRARKLMDQHQIDLDDLKEASGFGFAAVGKEYRFMPKWLDCLAVGVGYLNDCKVIKQHKWKSINASYSYQIVFQGYESDVQCATTIYNYLVDAGERMCKACMREIGEGTHYKASIGDPYKRGYSAELQRRMEDMAKQRREDPALLEHKTGTALVIFKIAEVEAEFGKINYEQQKNVRVRHDAGLDAMYRGVVDGKNINIQPHVE